MSNPLQWHVFVSTQIPVVTSDLPPGVAERRWSPISSTLISGERDAVLVDTFITVEQNRTLVEWIAASEKNLTTIWPRRSFLWRKHNSRTIPECAVRGNARCDHYHARAGLISRS